MKKFLLLLSFTLFFYVNPIIIKDANAVVLLSDTPCSETGYKKPCNCLKESSWVKKRICNFRAGIKKGDFIIIEDEETLNIKSDSHIKLFEITSPKKPSYPTYFERFG